MQLNDWIKKYEKKAEKFKVLPGFSIYYEPDKGFFCWKVIGNVFEVDHTCTNDVQHFYKVANDMAKEQGCILMRTQTFHNPSAYMRLSKARLNLELSGVRPNGKMYWVFEKEVI